MNILADTATQAADGSLLATTGTLVIVALIVACVFLFRSMTKQVKKVPASFPPPAGAAPQPTPVAPTAGLPGADTSSASASVDDDRPPA